MRREGNFGTGVAKILRKNRREEREMMWRMCERGKGISIMILPKKKNKKKKPNCGNWIVEIGGLKKKKKKERKLNCGKSNATTTNYFTIFLQTVVMTNFYWFSLRPTNNITFLFANNHLSHQEFMKVFVKSLYL